MTCSTDGLSLPLWIPSHPLRREIQRFVGFPHVRKYHHEELRVIETFSSSRYLKYSIYIERVNRQWDKAETCHPRRLKNRTGKGLRSKYVSGSLCGSSIHTLSLRRMAPAFLHFDTFDGRDLKPSHRVRMYPCVPGHISIRIAIANKLCSHIMLRVQSHFPS